MSEMYTMNKIVLVIFKKILIFFKRCFFLKDKTLCRTPTVTSDWLLDAKTQKLFVSGVKPQPLHIKINYWIFVLIVFEDN